MTNMESGADSNEQMVAKIIKNSREELRITLAQWKGYELLNFRVWFHAGNDDWRPGKSGFAIRVEHVPELAAAIDTALARIKGREAAE